MKKKIIINTSIRGYEKGKVLEIKTCSNGIPTDIYWRKRIKDSEFDGCINWHPEQSKEGKK